MSSCQRHQPRAAGATEPPPPAVERHQHGPPASKRDVNGWEDVCYLVRDGRDTSEDKLKDTSLEPDAELGRDRRQVRAWSCYIAGCMLILPALMAGWAALGPHSLLGTALFVVFASCAVGLLGIAESYFAPTARSVMTQDGRRPVLYLRPFVEDHKILTDRVDPWLSQDGERGLSVDDCLLSLNAIGPLVCIAEPSPNPGMHPIGAYRDEAGMGSWQARVLEMLDKSCLVVMALGDSPGIEWEIGQVRKRTSSGSLLLFLPPRGEPARSREDRERVARAAYGHFQLLIQKHFDIVLPPPTQSTYFIGFDARGQPVFPILGTSAERWIDESEDVASAVQSQLRSVLGRMLPGVELGRYQVHGRFARRTRMGLAAAVFLAGVPLSLFALAALKAL